MLLVKKVLRDRRSVMRSYRSFWGTCGSLGGLYEHHHGYDWGYSLVVNVKPFPIGWAMPFVVCSLVIRINECIDFWTSSVLSNADSFFLNANKVIFSLYDAIRSEISGQTESHVIESLICLKTFALFPSFCLPSTICDSI